LNNQRDQIGKEICMDENDEEKGKSKDKKNEGGRDMGGYFTSKRGLWLLGSGALGALAVLGIGKFSKKVRPTAVGAVKEGFAFTEWLAAKYEKAKEDIEDIVAEAKHERQKDIESTIDLSEREEDILRKVEEILKKRSKKEEV
jgi:hypothetical protein